MTSEIRQRMTGSHIRGPLSQIAGMIATARQRARDRAALSQMDDRDLGDMRLSRGAVAYELNKPFWRA